MRRALGLDIGDRTIGIAVSDPLGLTAQGVETIRRKNLKTDLARLAALMQTYATQLFVVGYPRHMNGDEGERCAIVRQFMGEVQKALPAVEVIYWDERLSTVAAERSLIFAGTSRAKRRKVIDKMAAVFILQGYLDGQNLKQHRETEAD